MLSINAIDPSAPQLSLAYGQLLLRRGSQTPSVSFIETGHVALGMLENGVMDHQIGVLEGPCWLDASSVLLDLPHLVDAVADSPVRLRQVPIQDFKKSIDDLPEYARSVLLDVALAHRKQTEYAVSRLAKDAEARCAEWLLSHAERSEQGVMAVQLQQRKRSIAVQLGIAPETFSRVLRHLREQSLISGSGRVLNLVNPSGLRSLAGV
jgi:CRP-like cAMP-binding protein